MPGGHQLVGLMKWVEREQWSGAFADLLDRHLGPACARAGVTPDELLELIGEHHTTVVWSCAFEDFLARNLDDGRNIVDDYLKRRGWKESASNRAYMAALRSSVMSLYEISDIVPEQSFLARDLVRGGEPVRVSERLGTRSLKQWDRMAARVLQVGTKTVMAGGALLFDHKTSETVLKALRQAEAETCKEVGRLARRVGRGALNSLPDDALSDTELLRASAVLFTNSWLGDTLKRVLNPTLPRLCNSDGDEIVFTTVSYPLKPAVTGDAIGRALAAIPALRQESETFWNWSKPQLRAKASADADIRILQSSLDDGSLVLGTVELKDKLLVLNVNSQQREQRGRALIEPMLGDLVEEPQIESQTPAELMAAPPPADRPKTRPLGLAPDEERALVHASLDRHYVHLLDEPVPMLGNITPRQAAKTANGREKLVAWLKLMENQTARHQAGSPMAGYDLSWMWERLGVADLRR